MISPRELGCPPAASPETIVQFKIAAALLAIAGELSRMNEIKVEELKQNGIDV